MLKYQVKQKKSGVLAWTTLKTHLSQGWIADICQLLLLFLGDRHACSFSVSQLHTKMKVCRGVQWFNQRFGV